MNYDFQKSTSLAPGIPPTSNEYELPPAASEPEAETILSFQLLLI
jgi:hypothetical protein